MISDSFYRTERISGRMWAIRSRTGEIMYLIEGDDRALLVDTCLGVGNLRAVVEELTDKPVTVVLTHGHVDHALGAPLFDDVYMNPADNMIFVAHSPIAEREGYIESNLRAEPGSWANAEWVPPVEPHFKPLEDGMTFDLGGIVPEVYALPGHTPGTMVVLVPEERVLITGDAANNSTFVFDEFALPIETYRANVRAVEQRLAGRYDRCFMMHHVMEASGQLLSNVAAVCDDIMAGTTDDVPFSFRGGSYLVAKAATPQFQRLDGGEGNVIYAKDKVFAS